ncbi:hypothetical protein ABZP36_012426 [Zizania latifolia]
MCKLMHCTFAHVFEENKTWWCVMCISLRVTGRNTAILHSSTSWDRSNYMATAYVTFRKRKGAFDHCMSACLFPCLPLTSNQAMAVKLARSLPGSQPLACLALDVLLRCHLFMGQ